MTNKDRILIDTENEVSDCLDDSFRGKSDVLDLEDRMFEQNRYLIQKYVYERSKRFWESAKSVLEKGNYSPFVYFNFILSEYEFLEGVNQEELLFNEGEVMTYNGFEVVISPLVYQRMFVENVEDSFVVFATAGMLQEHLERILLFEQGFLETVSG